MGRSLPVLKNARIASPCDKSWSAMAGDDRVRYCDACEKNVYNLIGMSDEDVTALILEKEDNLCVRLYQRRDGTLMTSDCPVGLRAARRKLARAIGAVAACFSMLITASVFGGVRRGRSWRLVNTDPFARVANWFAPPPSSITTGKMMVSPRPTITLPGRLNTLTRVPPPTTSAK